MESTLVLSRSSSSHSSWLVSSFSYYLICIDILKIVVHTIGPIEIFSKSENWVPRCAHCAQWEAPIRSGSRDNCDQSF